LTLELFSADRRLVGVKPIESRTLRSLSIVIPTLNEADELEQTVRRARAIPEVAGITVVDGGSCDGTVELATALGCTVLMASASRGGQLRLGANEATGDVILLLHADTWLPPGAGRAALACFQQPDVVGGAFWKIFRDPTWLMRGSRARCGLRLWLGGRLMGDQAIFVRRDALEKIGGVPDLPLMEEFELCRRLRRLGRLVLADATVSTSTRRFQKHGVLRTYWRMGEVTIRHWLGQSPDSLRRIYDKK
jgi:rSAM/selenodomain-associated transferase 2